MNDSSIQFYSDLPPFEVFSDQFESHFQVSVPEDWFVVVADVEGSTIAVAEGRYKDVNVVGASCIIAVLNACKGYDIPYVFGGDGASFLVPESLLAQTAEALSGTQDMALEAFGLNLRVGAVPIPEIYEKGVELKVSKYQVSPSVYIAMFHGGGMAYADVCVKSEDNQKYTAFFDDDKKVADFDGLECRWNPISTTKDHVLTLMVLSRTGDSVYIDVVREIKNIFGVSTNYRPVNKGDLKLSFSSDYLKQEAAVQTCGASFLKRLLYRLKMRVENFLGVTLLFFNATAVGFEGRKYVDDVVMNTDFQKFDDTLRIILDSTSQQKEALISYLNQRFKEGDLFYGVSVSDAAMMTCLIFERKEKHVHFVDGHDGGYTMAAKDMKQQMKDALNSDVKQADGDASTA